jgi:G3E family GTPase
MAQFHNIVLNIVTGFLGAGKTTALQYLLAHKPDSEVWAVVVNEFGQSGLDGKLLKNSGVAVKEIAGGCLCCVAAQPFTVGLNQLIKQYHPQRILIEPSGLGHPQQLLSQLSGEFYRDVFDLRAVITLLDARQLHDARYLEHETFVSQLALADVLVGNKMDQYSEADRTLFYQLAEQLDLPKERALLREGAQLELSWLDIPHVAATSLKAGELNLPTSLQSMQRTPATQLEPSTIKTVIKSVPGWQITPFSSDAHFSCSWRLPATCCFSEALPEWLGRLAAEAELSRIKGLLCTGQGWVTLNITPHETQLLAAEAGEHNILEIISMTPLSVNQITEQLQQSQAHSSAEATQ